MPPTGPALPSGLIVPVIVVLGSSGLPRSIATIVDVISMPADGPSMWPLVPIKNS